MSRTLTRKAVNDAVTVAVVAVVAVVVLLLLTVGFKGGSRDRDVTYRSLDYDVVVHKNGDLRFTEHIDVSLPHRSAPWHQLYQRYQLSDEQLSAITDVSVKDVATGTVYRHGTTDSKANLERDDWDEVDAGSWYASVNADECKDMDLCAYRPAAMTSSEFDAVAKDALVEDKYGGEDGKSGGNVASADDDADGSDADEDGDDETSSSDSSNGRAGDTVEIGWNIPVTDSASSMKFDVSMTFKDVVSVYDDVAYFKWEPVGDDNTTLIDTLSADVTLPQGVVPARSWAWLHYGGASTTSRAADGHLRFEAKSVEPENHVDLVSMFDRAAMGTVRHRQHGERKDDIMEEERHEEDSAHYVARSRGERYLAYGVTNMVAIALLLAAVVLSNRSVTNFDDVRYNREIPDIGASSAAKLYGLVKGRESKVDSRSMSATLLELACMHLIALYPGPHTWYGTVDVRTADNVQAEETARQQGGNTTTIVMTERRPDGAGPTLSDSQRTLLTFLQACAHRFNSPVFDLQQVGNELERWKHGAKLHARFATCAQREFRHQRLARPDWLVALAVAVTVVACVTDVVFLLRVWRYEGWGLTLLMGLPVMFCYLVLLQLPRYTKLTSKGVRETRQLLGLERYLDDADAMASDSPDVRLWSRYLVYATAIGSDRWFIERLGRAYPQLNDGDWLDEHVRDLPLYWYCRVPDRLTESDSTASSDARGGFDFTDFGAQLASGLDDVQASVEHVLSSGSSSDGSFSDGGFSGSGGGAGDGSFGGR